jgi:hypothetical protein
MEGGQSIEKTVGGPKKLFYCEQKKSFNCPTFYLDLNYELTSSPGVFLLFCQDSVL